MEREIWEVLLALEAKKITVIEAHRKICDISNQHNTRNDVQTKQL